MAEAAATLRVSPLSRARRTLLAEVLARLSGYLCNSDPDRSADLADEALRMARLSGDQRALSLALMCSTHPRPVKRDERLARLREAADLATST